MPAEFWRWLADRNSAKAEAPPNWSQPALAKCLSELIEPMLADAKPTERTRYARAPEMVAAMFHFTSSQAAANRWTFANRMLAACLMPLYRCLATGEINEAIRQTRVALSETLALCCAAAELGTDLDQLLDRDASFGVAPHDCLQNALDFQLGRLAGLLTFAGSQWDHEDDSHLVEWIDPAQSEPRSTRSAAWANPAVLWRLAGELMSKRADFVMPREWINIPVPWGSVSEHWSSLEHLLCKHDAQIADAVDAEHGGASIRSATAPSTSNLPTERVDRQPTSGDDSTDVRATEQHKAPEALWGGNPVERTQTAPSKPTPDSPGSSAEEEKQLPQPVAAAEDAVGKVILGEVRSRNDSVFVNLISRQLSTCRSDDRSVSLMAIRVEPEEEQDRSRLEANCDNGLVAWQQKLVNWLADQPDVREPYGFISAEGELILCLLDVERNAATSLLRQGLVEILTGKRLAEDMFGSLARVQIPARYHAGIASVSSPAASFVAQQLIAATFRCLEAAQRHGKASIKSIEVY